MSHEKEHWIETVVAPLHGDAELRLMAEQQLGEVISPEASDEDLKVVSKKLGDLGKQRWRLIWLTIVMLVSVPLIAGTLFKLGSNLGPVRTAMSPMMAMAGSGTNQYPKWARDLSNQERLVVFGAEGAMGEVDRWEPLWKSDPDNPLYFQEYALAYLQERSSLPPDFTI